MHKIAGHTVTYSTREVLDFSFHGGKSRAPYPQTPASVTASTSQPRHVTDAQNTPQPLHAHVRAWMPSQGSSSDVLP